MNKFFTLILFGLTVYNIQSTQQQPLLSCDDNIAHFIQRILSLSEENLMALSATKLGVIDNIVGRHPQEVAKFINAAQAKKALASPY